jgi:hypothetical protein
MNKETKEIRVHVVDSHYRLPIWPTSDIVVTAERQPVDVFTSRGQFVHRLEIGRKARFRPSRLLMFRVLGIVRWDVVELP